MDNHLSDADFNVFSEAAKQLAGIHLDQTKRQLVITRLMRRVRELDLDDLNSYRNFFADNRQAEEQNFVNAITTNLTYFFRESHHFDSLQAWVNEHRPRHLRVWSAACSSGQEPYSVAFALDNTPANVATINCTDIDTNCIQTAQRGVYRLSDIEELPPEQQRQFFQKGTGKNDGMVRVKQRYRDLLSFGQLNLIDRWPEQIYDIIFCRNVFIYFERDLQHKLLNKFAKHLAPGGLLFLGHSELLDPDERLFEVIGKTTYRRTQYDSGEA